MMSDMDVDSQPSNEGKKLWLPAAMTNISDGAKRRKEHLDRYYMTRSASDLTTDADLSVPAAVV